MEEDREKGRVKQLDGIREVWYNRDTKGTNVKKKPKPLKLTAADVDAIEGEIDFLTYHIGDCRKKHKKIDLEFIKWHTKNLYEWIIQIEMLHKGKIPRVGIDTPNW